MADNKKANGGKTTKDAGNKSPGKKSGE